MSGHSKWHSIKHKKGAADAKRGKVFTRFANLITIAVKEGGKDPAMNPALRIAIDNAKRENVPNANIDRAIKRGAGELKDANEISEMSYEGYGPGGTTIIVECLTDNKNRTYTSIRTIFSKKGGSLGNSGSVSWMFDRKGIIRIDTKGKNLDDIELMAIDAGASDIIRENDSMEILTSPTDLNKVVEKLKENGIIIEQAELLQTPNQTVEVKDVETAQKIINFIDAIEEDEDVTNVSSNFDISEEIMNQLS